MPDPSVPPLPHSAFGSSLLYLRKNLPPPCRDPLRPLPLDPLWPFLRGVAQVCITAAIVYDYWPVLLFRRRPIDLDNRRNAGRLVEGFRAFFFYHRHVDVKSSRSHFYYV